MARIVGSRDSGAGTCPVSCGSDAGTVILHRMARPARRLGTALLWIAIALLPLRGLAASLMPAMVQPVASVVAATDEMPCHGAASDLAAAGEPHAEPAVAVGDCPTCSLCALCHGSVAQAPQLSLDLPALPALPPAAAPSSAIEPRAPDGLFRPPRTLLA
jgi:hypothetical protein